MMKNRFLFPAALFFAFCAAGSPRLNAQVTQGARPVFNYNLDYQYGFNFRYPSPEGWAGVVQVNDSVTGAPYYGGLNQDERALYFKYMPGGTAPSFNPNISVKLYRKSPGVKPDDFLNNYVVSRASGSFEDGPRTTKIAGRKWMSAKTAITVTRGENSYKLRRKFYLLDYKEVFLLLELVTTEDQLAEDEKVFDASVKAMKFEKELEVTPDPPVHERAADTVIFSYTTKEGETFSRPLVGETPDMYIVRAENGEEIIIMKKDLLKGSRLPAST